MLLLFTSQSGYLNYNFIFGGRFCVRFNYQISAPPPSPTKFSEIKNPLNHGVNHEYNPKLKLGKRQVISSSSKIYWPSFMKGAYAPI